MLELTLGPGLFSLSEISPMIFVYGKQYGRPGMTDRACLTDIFSLKCKESEQPCTPKECVAATGLPGNKRHRLVPRGAGVRGTPLLRSRQKHRPSRETRQGGGHLRTLGLAVRGALRVTLGGGRNGTISKKVKKNLDEQPFSHPIPYLL